jgi:transposase InsO family protein
MDLGKTPTSKMPQCSTCDAVKFRKRAFSSAVKLEARAKMLLECVHSDMAVQMRTSVRGYTGFALFIDEASRHVTCVPIKKKTECFAAWCDYLTHMQHATGERVKRLHSDNGGVHVSGIMQRYNANLGIKQTFSPPRTAQLNSIAERAIGVLKQNVRAILKHAGMSGSWWCWAIRTATYLRNRSANTNSVYYPLTSHEVLYGSTPHVGHLRVPFCIGACLVHPEDRNDKSLGDRSEPCRLLAFDEHRPGVYEVLLARGRTTRTTHARFYEDLFDFKDPRAAEMLAAGELKYTGEPPVLSSEAISASPPNPDAPASGAAGETKVPPRENSTRDRQAPLRHGQDQYSTWAETNTSNTSNQQPSMQIRDDILCAIETAQQDGTGVNETINKNLKDMMKLPDSDDWRVAVNTELKALETRGTWTVAERKKGRKTIGVRFTFARKSTGLRKARLVARGFSAIKGVHYDTTFSGTARNTAIRTLLAIAANKGMQLGTLDCNNAYLHADIQHEVYLDIPEGYIPKGLEGKVSTHAEAQRYYCLRVRKCIYGLPQSGAEWQRTLAAKLVSMGYKKCTSDPCIFVKHLLGAGHIIHATYVDDLLSIFTPTPQVKAVLLADVNELDSTYGVKSEVKHDHKRLTKQQKQRDHCDLNPFSRGPNHPSRGNRPNQTQSRELHERCSAAFQRRR